ncbi:unnamed protein product, partial [marine sediment metagenome]
GGERYMETNKTGDETKSSWREISAMDACLHCGSGILWTDRALNE